MKTYIGSSFSLQMVPNGGTISVTPLGDAQRAWAHACAVESVGLGTSTSPQGTTRSLDAHSIVGHEGTAQALSRAWGVTVPLNREAIALKLGDILYVAQPTGRRIVYGQEVEDPELTLFRVELIPSAEEVEAEARKREEAHAWSEFLDRQPGGGEELEKEEFDALRAQFLSSRK